jgi:hypothetical protein
MLTKDQERLSAAKRIIFFPETTEHVGPNLNKNHA